MLSKKNFCSRPHKCSFYRGNSDLQSIFVHSPVEAHQWNYYAGESLQCMEIARNGECNCILGLQAKAVTHNCASFRALAPSTTRSWPPRGMKAADLLPSLSLEQNLSHDSSPSKSNESPSIRGARTLRNGMKIDSVRRVSFNTAHIYVLIPNCLCTFLH